jgi:hypothetical protein
MDAPKCLHRTTFVMRHNAIAMLHFACELVGPSPPIRTPYARAQLGAAAVGRAGDMGSIRPAVGPKSHPGPPVVTLADGASME